MSLREGVQSFQSQSSLLHDLRKVSYLLFAVHVRCGTPGQHGSVHGKM